MRCDEIQEHLIDLLYEEESPSAESLEWKEHLRTCSACRQELEELKQTRQHLQLWKDESPARSIPFARQEFLQKRKSAWTYLRYAAVAAMALLCFLALANTEITWTEKEFSLRTSLFRRVPEPRQPQQPQPVYYTKSEVRSLIKQALDENETRSAVVRPASAKSEEYYTKSEVRSLLKRALDDSEAYMNEANIAMIQKVMDTMERERMMEARLTRGGAARSINN